MVLEEPEGADQAVRMLLTVDDHGIVAARAHQLVFAGDGARIAGALVPAPVLVAAAAPVRLRLGLTTGPDLSADALPGLGSARPEQRLLASASGLTAELVA